ncbi:hypothetical protein BC829DRAFT_378230 [Chytridium lagenaria]|nr:hypothetical protein BC829DRAFT_378230 [Chytridium lagenaria]
MNLSGASSREGRKEGEIDVSAFTLREAIETSKEITETQKMMHLIAMKDKLKELKMTPKDYETFLSYRQNIKKEIRELRVILEAAEAKKRETVWLKSKTSGDLDETKLIEGIAGEKAIYKLRGDNEDNFNFQDLPKRIASMIRFNGHDQRLERSLECALLIMEAFKNFEHKFVYEIAGHSGDGANITFVQDGQYPKNDRDMFEVLTKMRAHSQYCLSGDNTLAAIDYGVQSISKKDADDYYVLILSDANIQQYNIAPAQIAKALNQSEAVNASLILIGSLQDQAKQIAKAMPESAFICMNTKELPQILKKMFLSSMLKNV